MKREFFNTQFAALLAGYTIANKIPDETQDIYWEMLKDIPEDKFHAGVIECLRTCKFFPAISELGAASLPTRARTIRQKDRFVTIEESWFEQISRIKQLN